jgi:hypothetical protein
MDDANRPIVSTPVVKLTFSSIVNLETKVLAFATAAVQPPSPEMGSIEECRSKYSTNGLWCNLLGSGKVEPVGEVTGTLPAVVEDVVVVVVLSVVLEPLGP